MSDTKTTPICPNCRKTFICGVVSGESCWCFAYPKIMTTDSPQCYCPDCLKEEIDRQLSRQQKKQLVK